MEYGLEMMFDWFNVIKTILGFETEKRWKESLDLHFNGIMELFITTFLLVIIHLITGVIFDLVGETLVKSVVVNMTIFLVIVGWTVSYFWALYATRNKEVPILHLIVVPFVQLLLIHLPGHIFLRNVHLPFDSWEHVSRYGGNFSAITFALGILMIYGCFIACWLVGGLSSLIIWFVVSLIRMIKPKDGLKNFCCPTKDQVRLGEVNTV